MSLTTQNSFSNKIFYKCVDYLEIWAEALGISYELINIIIFPLALFWGSSFFWIPVNILITGYLISKEYTEALGLRKLTFIEIKELKNKKIIILMCQNLKLIL